MSLTDWVIRLCHNPPEQRSKSDVEAVAAWVNSKSDYFKNSNVPQAAICDVIRGCTLQNYKKYEIIIRQGNIGDAFYILVSGKVSVYIDQRMTGELDQEDTNAKEHQHLNLDDSSGNIDQMKTELLGSFIRKQREGYAFGEIALTSKDSIRNASIIADEDCVLMVVHRDLFTKCLREYQDKEFQERIDLINSKKIFKGMTSKQIRALQMSLQKIHYQFGEYLIHQGLHCNGLIFLMKGSVRYLVDLNKHEQQYATEIHLLEAEEHRAQSTNEELRINMAKQKTEMHFETLEEQTKKSVYLRRQYGYSAAESKVREKQHEFRIFSEGSILGDIEYTHNINTNIGSAICTEPTTIYILEKNNCNRVFKRNLQNSKRLKDLAVLKIKNLAEQVPFLKLLEKNSKIKKIMLRREKTMEIKKGKLRLSQDELWLHMLSMYRRGQVPSVAPPAETPSLYYRDMCSINAKKRKEQRLAQLSKLDKRDQQEDEDQHAHDAHTQHVTPRVPKSINQLRKLDVAAMNESTNPFQAMAVKRMSLPNVFSQSKKSGTKKKWQKPKDDPSDEEYVFTLENNVRLFLKSCDESLSTVNRSHRVKTPVIPHLARFHPKQTQINQ